MSSFTSEPQTPRPMLRLSVIGDSLQRRAEVLAVLNSIAELRFEVEQHEAAIFRGNGNGNCGGASAAPPDALVVLLEEDDASFACLHRLAALAPCPSLIALLPEAATTATLRRAVRSGAKEVLYSPVRREEMTRALIKVTEEKRRAQRRSGGTVCAVSSLTGGVGVSTVSINLALALARTREFRVVLVDLDLQKGTLAVSLNLPPDHSILSLVEGEHAPDSLKVEAAVARHSSGIYLLAAPRRIEDDELVSDKAVALTLQLLRTMFDAVIVDTGNYITEQAVAAWEESDHLLYLLDQSITSAHRASRFADLFTRLVLDSVTESFVLNRFSPAYPVSREQIARALHREIRFALPRDDKAMERIELSGKDLWQVAPTAPLAQAFEDLARSVVCPAAESAAPRSTTAVSRMISALMSRRRGVEDEAR